jgi:hypothetical protein
MADARRTPLNLRAARRSLAGVGGCQVSDDWSFDDRLDRWVLRCRLTIASANDFVPAVTDWHVVVSPSYPWGPLRFFPSKEGGLEATFAHQEHNSFGPGDVPWRTGGLCDYSGLRALGRHGYKSEPFEANSRLRWHVLRALDWLRAAATDTLVQPGEPFELPHFPGAAASRALIAFEEGDESFLAWRSTADRFGLAELTPVHREADVFAVTEFRSLKGDRLWRPSWHLNSPFKSRPEDSAAWLRLDSVPVLDPWHTPETWGELRAACARQGMRLDEPMRSLLRLLRDGRPHNLLVGFPIPLEVGGPATQMHWQAIALPTVSHRGQTRRGFRPQREGQWLRDRELFLKDPAKVEWVETANWNQERLVARGRLRSPLAKSHVLLLGGGALGSAVAELLVRAGVRRLSIMDGQDLEVGNLCRHTLLMSDIRQNKAESLAARLRRANPHGEIEAIEAHFPPSTAVGRESLRNIDAVIDCTADDAALRELGQYEWPAARRFASVSLGFGARRLFCFATAATVFPSGVYRGAIQPWLERQQEEAGGVEFLREGAGCWHPIFPARADDIWLLAAAAVKYLDHVFQTTDLGSKLAVFEQHDEGGFSGLTRVVQEI